MPNTWWWTWTPPISQFLSPVEPARIRRVTRRVTAKPSKSPTSSHSSGARPLPSTAPWENPTIRSSVRRAPPRASLRARRRRPPGRRWDAGIRPGRRLRDRVHDPGPVDPGQVVAQGGEEQQAGRGDGGGRPPAVLRRQQRVGLTVDDQGRDAHPTEGLEPGGSGGDRRQLTLRPLDAHGPVHRARPTAPGVFLVEVDAPEDAADPDPVLDHALPVGRWPLG